MENMNSSDTYMAQCPACQAIHEINILNRIVPGLPHALCENCEGDYYVTVGGDVFRKLKKTGVKNERRIY